MKLTSFLPDTLAGYFISKGMDQLTAPNASLRDDLQDVIQETIVEYSDNDIRTYGNKLPFYHSATILQELLKFRLMAPEDYDINQLLTVIEQEADIAPPGQGELNEFYSLFISKVYANENLCKLEIKETYTDEIFTISRKITELGARIDRLAMAYTGDLEMQWKDRVDAYVKTLQEFKPATALKLLESLESSIQSGTKKPGRDFMAFLAYQKGQCLEFLGRKEEGVREKLKAWHMNPNNVIYGQSAAIHLFRAGDALEVAKTTSAILAIDPYNPVAWALNTLVLAKEGDLEVILRSILTIIKQDETFRRVLYNEADEILQNHIVDLGLVPNCLDYSEKEVTIDGFSNAVFWINSAVRTIFRIYFLDYFQNNQSHRSEITVLNRMLTRFLEKTRGSELYDKFYRSEFLLSLTEFSLHGDKERAIELEVVYRRTPDKEVIMAIQTANALQLVGLFDSAINLLEMITDLTSEGLLLLVYCYQKKGDTAGYCDASKRFSNSITIFDNKYLLMYLNLMVEIKLQGVLHNFTKNDFSTDKTFDDQQTKNLVDAVTDLIFDEQPSNEICSLLNEIASSSEDSKLVDILGSAFFAAELYESALNILGKNLEGKSAGRELYQYIHAAHKTGKDYRELLSMLEDWRLSSPFSPQFCRLEVQMRRDLVEWRVVVDICEYYLENLPNESFMLAMLARSLHQLNDPIYNDKITTLPDRSIGVDMRAPHHLIAICDVLFMHGYTQEAFDLLYPKAINASAIELRATYARLVLNRGDNLHFFTEYDIVEAGHFVKYVRDGHVAYIELTEEALLHRVYREFVGKCVGDEIIVKRQLGNLTDQFKIARIMNKYLALFDQILNQSEEDPYAGLPFASFKFDNENPGSFLETLQAMFGDRQKIEEETKDVNFDAYYNSSISLTELIVREYGAKFIDGYYNLIRYRDGIITFRDLEFAGLQDFNHRELVVDYTSLMLFYQVTRFHGYTFGVKFIISRYLVDAIQSALNDLLYGNDRFDTRGVEVGRSEINGGAFEFLKERAVYLQELIEWISLNCEVRLSDNTIDTIMKANVNIGENPMVDFALSTYLLVTDDEKRLLITEDSFCIRMGLLPLNRTTSSEHYLKAAVARGNANILNELVKNRFIGYSANEQQLNEEYSKMLAGTYTSYPLLLSNLSAFNSRTNMFTAIGHLKEIAMKPVLTNEQILNDMTSVLVNLLLPCNESLMSIFSQKLYVDFLLLGKKQDLAMMALQNAKQIILTSKI